MAKQINVGIIGAGRIGQLHARNLAFHVPEANVSAISDVYINAAQQCAKQCNITKVVKDYHEILDDKNIDAIFICSPTDTHAQIICEGAKTGKHIFCEKPIAFDLKQIDNALNIVKETGVKLQLGFNRRFDPSFKNAKDKINQGKIGTPHIIRITSRDPAPPPPEYIKVSGGLFLDMAIHDFDMCRYLIEEEVTEIYATGNALIDPTIGELGDIDTAVTTLKYQSGAFCTIDNSRKAVYGYDQRIEIFGSEGCIIVGNREPYTGSLYTSQNVSQALPYHFFLDRYHESYVEEARCFLQCIVEDTEPLVTGYDGKIAVVMGLVAKQSFQERQPILLT
ncbi:MAG: inositol 2-dehydrogenase [Gammaproteobacteria bacterium]|jgi:myo-inositol 2-dehydrogenase/D-chiro-inositol 1-dehydrogenase